MEPGNSLPHLEGPAFCPNPEPEQSIPCYHPTAWRSILILSSHLRLGVSSDLLPYEFLTKTLYAPLISPVRAHALHISFLLMWPPA